MNISRLGPFKLKVEIFTARRKPVFRIRKRICRIHKFLGHRIQIVLSKGAITLRKILIYTVLWLLTSLLSLKTDVNVPSVSNKQKYLLFVGILKVTKEKIRIQIRDPQSKGTDPRILCIKTSWRRVTGQNWEGFTVLLLSYTHVRYRINMNCYPKKRATEKHRIAAESIGTSPGYTLPSLY
jgi:hypothetical protein